MRWSSSRAFQRRADVPRYARLVPLAEIAPALVERAGQGNVKEVVLALNATAADISRQLRQIQQDASGGRADVGGLEQSVRTIATVHSAEELARMHAGTRLAEVVDDGLAVFQCLLRFAAGLKVVVEVLLGTLNLLKPDFLFQAIAFALLQGFLNLSQLVFDAL